MQNNVKSAHKKDALDDIEKLPNDELAKRVNTCLDELYDNGLIDEDSPALVNVLGVVHEISKIEPTMTDSPEISFTVSLISVPSLEESTVFASYEYILELLKKLV
jgi:hypothetical protein